jgi:coenzyme F420-reducing hydrogenase beta subunit
MRISQLAATLGLEVAQDKYEDRDISGGYASDLLSDVMANAKADGVLVTVQAHKNAIAVASLVGLGAVVVCNSRPLPDDMLAAAAAEGVAVFRSPLGAFEVSGRLWAELHKP